MLHASIRGKERVIKKLDKAQANLFIGVENSVKTEALNLLRYVKENKLSGQVLQVRTGRLRRSMTAKFEGQGTGTIRAIVGTNLKYGRAWELGFKGDVKVKAFQRMQKMAFGQPMKNPRMVEVKSFTRKMDMKARPFLGPSLEDNKQRILDNIREALSKALKS